MFHTGVSSHMDDEYKWAGVEDPKVMVTTSRDPSSRLKMFAKVSVFGIYPVNLLFKWRIGSLFLNQYFLNHDYLSVYIFTAQLS